MEAETLITNSESSDNIPISSIASTTTGKLQSSTCRAELDSHADTCCFGRNALVVSKSHRVVRVKPFIATLGSMDQVPIVTVAVAYDDPVTTDVVILLFHQVLYFEELDHHLICPMQLRLNDVTVNECPKFLTKSPTLNDHSIQAESLLIPLSLEGVTSYFPVRKPTRIEFEECHRIELTAAEQMESTMVVDESPMKARNIFLLETNTEFLDASQFTGCLEEHCIVAVDTIENSTSLSPERLAALWNVGLSVAKKTLQCTTQKGVRSTLYPSIERRWPTGDRALRYRRLGHDVYHDTLHARVISLRGHKFSEIYCTGFGWSRNFPISRISEVHDTLNLFLNRYGIPSALISDGAKVYEYGEFNKLAKQAGCYCKYTDPHSPWQNRAEGEIRELKRLTARWLLRSQAPHKLWDECCELASLVRSHVAHDMYQLQGQVPETIMMGQTADISHICEFGWYQWVYVHDQSSKWPESTTTLGRYLGPTSPEHGNILLAKILISNGQVIRRNTFRHLRPDEADSEDVKRQQAEFDSEIRAKLGAGISQDDIAQVNAMTPQYDPYEDDETQEVGQGYDPDVFQKLESDGGAFDNYILTQVLLPRGDEFMLGTVKKRVVDTEGKPIGKLNDNPILDSRLYEVEFPDGHILEYSANIIAENLYSQVDEQGRQYILLDQIIDHKRTEAATPKGEEFITVNGKRCQIKNTKGWQLCVQWKDGSTSWESLTNLKESNPVEVAEYAIAHRIANEPAFSWWVPFTLKQRSRIIASVNKRYLKRTHKFGIEIPKSVQEALEIDRCTNTTFWRDAIQLEMGNVDIAFEDLDDQVKLPPGYQFIKCHLVFDVKMGSLKRKARLVAGGHMTEDPIVNTYASVVSRESVRIGLLIAALNDLDILAADIQNAYLTSPCQEKIYTILGPEFGREREGKRSIIVRALYGLKSAGASFRQHLATCLSHLGYQSSKGDPDVWLKPALKPVTNEPYYEYLFVYTDDILAIGIDPNGVLQRLNKYFPLKADSIKTPDIYLGAKLRKVVLPNGVKAWAQSSSHYIQTVIKNLEDWLRERNMKLPNKAETPLVSTYRPEMDVSDLLDPEDANYYQSLIGTLRWIVEIGRIDITTETSMLAAHLAMPRYGHLLAALRVFAYLKKKHNARIVFDPTYPKVHLSDFQEVDWQPFYGNLKEAIPVNAPEPRGKSVVLRCYVDADHAGDLVTRRSRTGFVQFINMAPINWYSKKQGSVETSTFGSEFVSTKTAMEANRGLRYRLRMMGVPIDGPTYMYVDNMSVVKNTSLPDSTLKKKSNAIAYHAVREAAAMGEIVIAYITSLDNIADLMTKVLPSGERRNRLIEGVLWDI